MISVYFKELKIEAVRGFNCVPLSSEECPNTINLIITQNVGNYKYNIYLLLSISSVNSTFLEDSTFQK